MADVEFRDRRDAETPRFELLHPYRVASGFVLRPEIHDDLLRDVRGEALRLLLPVDDVGIVGQPVAAEVERAETSLVGNKLLFVLIERTAQALLVEVVEVVEVVDGAVDVGLAVTTEGPVLRQRLRRNRRLRRGGVVHDG